MSAEATKASLLAAGERLAARLPLADLTAAALAAEAGLDESAVLAPFGGLEPYLVELQQTFMTELRDAVLRAAMSETGNRQRLRAGGVAYLDHCLQKRALRSWFLQARRQTAAVAAGLHKQDQAYHLLLGIEFRNLGWPHPHAAGRLFLSQLQDLSQEEHAVSRPLPDLRAALWDFLDTYPPAG